VSLGLALWILLAPLDAPGQWGWTIIGGPYESGEKCQEALAARLDQGRILCAPLKP